MRNGLANVLGLFLIVGLVSAGVAGEAPATQPSAPLDDATLELRANQAFEAGDWYAALPLLKRLAVRHKDDPQRVGPMLEKVRVAEANLPGSTPIEQSLSKNRKTHIPLKPDETREMTILELGNFDYDPDIGGGVPDDVKALSGGSIKLKGFMIPLDQANRITRFALVPDLFACCFGQPPGMQHTIVVRCPPGQAVAYYPDEIIVSGKLNVEEKSEDGFVISLF
ncbi:MAG TPA: DUF3299 domain-containing protein, partial [Tepidisphaeraceae bacterium]|nr:DUF3299 domain-containing protein [Tepidisphaeraceae bacterium]